MPPQLPLTLQRRSIGVITAVHASPAPLEDVPAATPADDKLVGVSVQDVLSNVEVEPSPAEAASRGGNIKVDPLDIIMFQVFS